MAFIEQYQVIAPTPIVIQDGGLAISYSPGQNFFASPKNPSVINYLLSGYIVTVPPGSTVPPGGLVQDSQLAERYILANGSRVFTGPQSMGANFLTNLLDPVNPQDAATKNYVDTHGGGLPPLIGVQFAVLMENPIGVVSWDTITQDMIAAAFGVSLSGGFNLEVGSSLINPTVNATYVRPPAVAVLTDTDGHPSQNVHGVSNPITRPYTYTHSAVNASVTFTDTANETGGASKSGSTTFNWLPKAFWGVGLPGQTSAAFIQGLAGSGLQSGRQTTFSTNAAAGQKIYYAYPSSFGAATFSVGGFAGGFLAPTVVSVTNGYSVTLNYNLYESAVTGLGSTVVVVT